jgi:hypothetical protein
MMVMRKRLTAIIFLLLTLAMITFNGTIKGLLTKTVTLPSEGTVKAIGIGVYWDSSCSNEVSSIDWGTAEAGSIKTVTVHIRNEGNAAITLSMNTTNWSPSTASSYISLSWDYSGQPIDPNGVIPVTLTLSVSSSITGISSFSFDIVITGSG